MLKYLILYAFIHGIIVCQNVLAQDCIYQADPETGQFYKAGFVFAGSSIAPQPKEPIISIVRNYDNFRLVISYGVEKMTEQQELRLSVAPLSLTALFSNGEVRTFPDVHGITMQNQEDSKMPFIRVTFSAIVNRSDVEDFAKKKVHSFTVIDNEAVVSIFGIQTKRFISEIQSVAKCILFEND